MIQTAVRSTRCGGSPPIKSTAGGQGKFVPRAKVHFRGIGTCAGGLGEGQGCGGSELGVARAVGLGDARELTLAACDGDALGACEADTGIPNLSVVDWPGQLGEAAI